MMLALAVTALAFAGAQEIHDGNLVRPLRVGAESIEGRLWFSVQAQNASALGVVREIARLSGRDVTGLDALDEPALVTVDLVDRPLDQVLEFTLGSLGLRADLSRTTIEIVSDRPKTADEHLDLAAAAWLRAWSRFPDHMDAPQARLAQAEIAEMRGLSSAARSSYLTLAEDYPSSAVVGEAYMRAGRISGQLGQWAEASRLFRTLSNLDAGSEYHAAARLEWARAMVAQGDPQAALYMLSALATNYPTTDVTELTGRRLVKARALNARELFMEALTELDRADPNFDDFGRWEALHIRALALEGVGLPGDAARAWLLYAGEANGNDRAHAYHEAARLSLAADDELAVLFVIRQAEIAGVTTGLEAYERDARQKLGLAVSDGAVADEEAKQ
jgi:tetratricopeptide (TPR) repeat protein